MDKNELSEGLGFGLAMNMKAMDNFAKLTDEEKQQVISASRQVESKEQMQHLIHDIENLNG